MENKLFKLVAVFLAFTGVGNNYCSLPKILPYQTYLTPQDCHGLTTKIRANGVYNFFMPAGDLSVFMHKVGLQVLIKFDVRHLFSGDSGDIDRKNLKIDLSEDCNLVVISHKQEISVFDAQGLKEFDGNACGCYPGKRICRVDLAWQTFKESVDGKAKRLKRSYDISYEVKSIAFSADGTWLVVVLDGFTGGTSLGAIVCVGEVMEAQLHVIKRGASKAIKSAKFLPNNDIVVEGAGANLYICRATRWDSKSVIKNAWEKYHFGMGGDAIVGLSPDGKFVAVCKNTFTPTGAVVHEKKIIEIWDVVSYKFVSSCGSDKNDQLDNMITDFRFIGNTGKIAVFYDASHRCEVHNFNTGQCLCVLGAINKWHFPEITCDDVGLPLDNGLAHIIHFNVPAITASNVYFTK